MGIIRYHISPSILDKYQAWQESDQSWEEMYSDSDIPAMTPGEWSEKLESELIAAINHDPQEPSRAADLGTCLNEAVDCILKNVASTRDDVVLHSMDVEINGGESQRVIAAVKGDNKFLFHTDDVVNLASHLAGFEAQTYESAIIQTQHGFVEIYGYPDYYNANEKVVVDLKTTKRYEHGKYRYKWQRIVYPYILTHNGKLDDVKMFTFLVCKVTGDGKTNPIVELEMYCEAYTDPVEWMGEQLAKAIDSFLTWYEIALKKGYVHDDLVGEHKK